MYGMNVKMAMACWGFAQQAIAIFTFIPSHFPIKIDQLEPA